MFPLYPHIHHFQQFHLSPDLQQFLPYFLQCLLPCILRYFLHSLLLYVLPYFLKHSPPHRPDQIPDPEVRLNTEFLPAVSSIFFSFVRLPRNFPLISQRVWLSARPFCSAVYCYYFIKAPDLSNRYVFPFTVLVPV